MGLIIYFPEDIQNALAAAEEASASTAAMITIADERLLAYRQGYRAALTTVALAFGLSPTIVASGGETVEVEAMRIGETIKIERR
jgi:hypothetical protein